MIKGYMTTDALVLLFLFFSLTLAIIIKQLQKVFSFIPYTPTLFIVSILLGKFSGYLGVIGQSIESTAEIDPRGILLIFLPPLIFQSSFNSDWYVFRRQSVQIFILAFPSVLVSALIIMFSIKCVVGYDDSYYTYKQAFMFGSVLSCTDTVAVLALLKEAGAPKKFSSLIQGQSLLNDGTCMILFTISLELCRGGSMGASEVLSLFVQLTGGAIVLGVLFGIIATELIKLFKNDSMLCYNVTLVGCYLLYFTAEYVHFGIHISGIMALVSMGLYMAAFGRTKFTAQATQSVHHIWKVFVFVAQTVIFILGGVIVGAKSLNNPKLTDLIGKSQIINLILMYFCMTFARFFSISLFMPWLKKLGYGLHWNEVVALTYGGLRGAVGIAFTLILAANDFLPQKFRFISIFNMAGLAFLTLVINAPTCSTVIIKLGLCNKSITKIKLFNRFMEICSDQLQQKLQGMKSNKYLSHANWQKVYEQSGIHQLRSHIKSNAGQQNGKVTNDQALVTLNRNLLSDHEQLDDPIDQNDMIQIRNRFGLALKGIFWKKFENNECSDLTIRKITECVDLDLDQADQPMNSWDFLISEEQSFLFFPIIFWLRQFPIVNRYAMSQIYHRISSIYDLVSTYIEGVRKCQAEVLDFPFDKKMKMEILSESSKNRKLAQSYLDYQIKISYPQIMKRIQTSKISQSILNYQRQLLQDDHKKGRLQEVFYYQMKIKIQQKVSQLQGMQGQVEQIGEKEALSKNEFFRSLSEDEMKDLMADRVQKLMQKDEPVVRSYEKLRYIYFVAKGQIHQEWKLQDNTYHKRNVKVFQFMGLSQIYMQNKAEVEYSATAISVACLYGFSIQKIKHLMLKSTQIEAILYKEMLPFLVQIEPKIDLGGIPSQTWTRLRPYVQFKRLLKGQSTTVTKRYLIVLDGRIEIEDRECSIGHYKLDDKQVAKVYGPAKIFISDDPYIKVEELHDRPSSRRKSERRSRLREDGPSQFDKALLIK